MGPTAMLGAKAEACAQRSLRACGGTSKRHGRARAGDVPACQGAIKKTTVAVPRSQRPLLQELRGIGEGREKLNTELRWASATRGGQINGARAIGSKRGGGLGAAVLYLGLMTTNITPRQQSSAIDGEIAVSCKGL